jgi:hypothetical protein
MNFKLNRLLHALAGKLVTPQHAHEYLRDLAKTRYKKESIKDLNDDEAKDLATHLRKEYPRMRQEMFGILHQGEQLITHEQIAYALDLQHKLGWSDKYLTKLLRNRYDEESLDLMPDWKAVRLIALLKRRWESKRLKMESTS